MSGGVQGGFRKSQRGHSNSQWRGYVCGRWIIGVGAAVAVYFIPWRKLSLHMDDGMLAALCRIFALRLHFLKIRWNRFINFIDNLLRGGASIAGAFCQSLL